MNLSQVRVIDPILTTVAQGYKDPGFVGMTLFPPVPVQVSGGKVIEFGKEAFMAYNTRRAPGGATKRVRFGYEGKPFSLEGHDLEAAVPREWMRDASRAPGVDLATRAIRMVQTVQARSLEIQQAGLATNQANYDSSHKVTLSGTSKWSDPASNPEATIETGKEAIRSSCGMYPNVLVLGPTVFAKAKTNPALKDRFKYTSKESITAEMLANAFDVDKVVVGKAVQATDAGVMSDIWGNVAVLAYVAPSSLSAEEPSYGYTYTMEGHPLVEQPYYDNNAKSWIYGVGYERIPVLSGITSGYLIQDLV
jgi:hypothetical protein